MTSIFSLNKDLLNRYKTIINNIKSPSPTFYDAYNEFIECLLKSLIKEYNFKNMSVVSIIDNKELYEKLILIINKDNLDKLKDYALKINKHKHESTKKLDINLVVKYFDLLINIINDINKYYHFKYWKIDSNKYIIDNYNKFEKDIIDLKKELINKNNNNKKLPYLNGRMIYLNGEKIISSTYTKDEFKKRKIIISILFYLLIIFLTIILAYNWHKDVYLGIGFVALNIPLISYIIYLFLKVLFSKRNEDFDNVIDRSVNPFEISNLGYYINSLKMSRTYKMFAIYSVVLYLIGILNYIHIFNVLTLILQILSIVCYITYFILIYLFMTSYMLNFIKHNNHYYLLNPYNGQMRLIVEKNKK